MIVIPAIDLKAGRCVRLIQGNFDRATVYADEPAAMASMWKARGATRLHVVDLDGSLAGQPRNEAAIQNILKVTGLPLQVGGGIRNMKTAEAYLRIGVRWVILGTAALRNPDFVHQACREFPDQVIIGIDARDGRVAIQGWTEKTNRVAAELARMFAEDHPAALVYTDIMRDGMETGVNIDATREFARETGMPVIASGGVSGIDDIERLMTIETEGVFAVIVGKALYTRALSLEAAIETAKHRRRITMTV